MAEAPDNARQLPVEFVRSRRMYDPALDIASLRVLVGPLKDVVLVLPEGLSMLGRSPECDLIIDVPSLSRRHCSFLLNEWELVVRDLESTHGVFVNGARATQARLFEGDELRLGEMSFRFEVRSRRAAGYEPHVVQVRRRAQRRTSR